MTERASGKSSRTSRRFGLCGWSFAPAPPGRGPRGRRDPGRGGEGGGRGQAGRRGGRLLRGGRGRRGRRLFPPPGRTGRRTSSFRCAPARRGGGRAGAAGRGGWG